MDFKIKETRAEYNITQKEMSEILEIPVRTIENWESGKRKPSKWVEKLIIDNLKHYPHNEYGIITESKGVYTVEQIKDLLLPLTLRYKIVKLVLFGSYSKGIQDEKSDIDLIVYGEDLFGLNFFGLLEDINNMIVKDVDLIHISQIEKGSKILEEVNKGLVIYER